MWAKRAAGNPSATVLRLIASRLTGEIITAKRLLYGVALLVFGSALAVAILFPSEVAGHGDPGPGGGEAIVFYEHYIVFRAVVATTGFVLAVGLILLGRYLGQRRDRRAGTAGQAA